MTLYHEEARIEQVLFGFTDRLDATKWSTGLTDQNAHFWSDRLNRYNRLSPTVVGSEFFTPNEAFSYFEFQDGQAALLARFRNTRDGRNKSHALVGPIEALAPYAMSLSEWEGWRREPDVHPLVPATPQDWYKLHIRWLDDALRSVENNRNALTNLLRAVLADGKSHFTVLDPPQPLRLLTLAREILNPILSPIGGEFRWTFSTYEDSDTTDEASPSIPEAPRFWCVRARPGWGETTRCRVDVTERPPDDNAAALAIDLIQRYTAAPDQFATQIRNELVQHRDRGKRVAALLGPTVDGYIDTPARVYTTTKPAWNPPIPAETVPAAEPFPQYVRPEQPAIPQSEPASRQLNVHRRLDELANDNLLPQQRQKVVAELHALWDRRDDLATTSVVLRIETMLKRYRIALAAAILVSFISLLVTWVAWPTPTVVRTPSPVTVTVRPPQPN